MYTAFYYPHVSGLTFYFQRLAEGLAKRGHNVTMLTAKHDRALSSTEIINGVKVVRTPYLFKFNKGLVLPLLALDAWKSIRSADVVHLNLPAFDSPIVALVAKFLRKRIVTTYVCDITLPSFVGSRMLDKFIDLNHKFVLNLSDRLASFTNDFAQHSRVMKSYADHTIEIYPQLDLPVKEKSIPILTKLNAENAVIIGMATRIAAEKGVHLVIEALDHIKTKFPNVKLAIAGSIDAIGEEEYMAKIKNMIKDRDDVFLLGKLELEEMVCFYKNIDVLTVASTNSTEAFGMVQVEAMLHGTPCVASNLPGVRMPVKLTGMGEVAQIGSVEDIAEKIVMVLSNENKYHKTVKQIKDIFDDEQTINKYLDLYEQTSSK
ncbi:glycosyltransferase family 4 protein [Candidatus Dojkabacteria bacterium]|uniref:Glycosyltransferase family 4 protein n=1 Tax=Candidatus Dojkabacteria bacterium TaxID=2099670 RepID=A0A955L561_9BACT|nr:glycosyltransferase family 4 protein [Candidatus Dojkabacteria bacterium]